MIDTCTQYIVKACRNYVSQSASPHLQVPSVFQYCKIENFGSLGMKPASSLYWLLFILQHFSVLSCLTFPMAKWSSLIELRDQRPLTLAILVLYCKVMSSECAWRMRPGLESHLPVSVSSNSIPDVPFLYYYLLSAETTCPDLPNPVNGIVDIQGNTPGGSAVYLCNPGLSLIGSSRRICNVDGTWSGEPPTCIGRLREYSYLWWNTLA